MSLIERPDLEACRIIWRHPAVKAEDRKRLKKYCDAALASADGSVKVEYQTKYEYGRYYVKDPSLHSACTMPGRVLNSSVRSCTSSNGWAVMPASHKISKTTPCKVAQR